MEFNMPPQMIERLAELKATAKGPLIYFAHPMSTYGTEYEALAIKALELQGLTVLNPAEAWVQESFQQFRADYPDQYMQFFKLLCDACALCAIMPFPSGLELEGLSRADTAKPMLGAGVIYEMDTFFRRNAPVRQLMYWQGAFLTTPVKSFEGFTRLTVPQTREALKVFKPY